MKNTFKTITYMEFAIGIFNTLEDLESKLSSNRLPVENFLRTLVDSHNNILEKYGNLHCLDSIFIEQIIDYYHKSIGASVESLKILTEVSLKDSKLPGFSTSTEECFIIYPSYVHKKIGNGAIKHIPVVDSYNLSGTIHTQLTQGDSDITLENGTEIIKNLAKEAAKKWTKEKDPTLEEVSLIADEILSLVFVEREAAYKEDVISYLAEETEQPELLRFL